jgi:hypothetical protein
MASFPGSGGPNMIAREFYEFLAIATLLYVLIVVVR